MTTEYLCNLIVPGAAKSGTSSLHIALNKHPKISMSENKEPHYFSRAEKYLQGDVYHNSLFSQGSEINVFGESSTSYMIFPDAIERISNNLSNPKIIILLRHPVSRTISHWKWRVKLGLEVRPLLESVETDGYGFDPEKPHGYGHMAYLQFSKYSKYCPLWIDRFGQDNCLFITHDDFRKDFQITMSKCFSFLNIDSYTFSDDVKANETKDLMARPRPFMTKMMSPLPSGLKKTALYRNVRNLILRMYTSNAPAEVSKDDIKFIEDALREDIEYFNMMAN